ncbi:MAG: hypothetical protein M0006_04320 [Magnetospirillum sp.]|nr:hypothetical protein [Magnetospirillum sp.]
MIRRVLLHGALATLIIAGMAVLYAQGGLTGNVQAAPVASENG